MQVVIPRVSLVDAVVNMGKYSKSRYGRVLIHTSYCGSSIDHCMVARGCQNGCLDAPTAIIDLDEEPSATSEPRIKPVGALMSADQQSRAPTTVDGTCGSSNGGTVCGNWPDGNCCSMYGFW